MNTVSMYNRSKQFFIKVKKVKSQKIIISKVNGSKNSRC